MPAHCKIYSENFVGARAPRTRRSAPHGIKVSETVSDIDSFWQILTTQIYWDNSVYSDIYNLCVIMSDRQQQEEIWQVMQIYKYKLIVLQDDFEYFCIILLN